MRLAPPVYVFSLSPVKMLLYGSFCFHRFCLDYVAFTFTLVPLFSVRDCKLPKMNYTCAVLCCVCAPVCWNLDSEVANQERYIDNKVNNSQLSVSNREKYWNISCRVEHTGTRTVLCYRDITRSVCACVCVCVFGCPLAALTDDTFPGLIVNKAVWLIDSLNRHLSRQRR